MAKPAHYQGSYHVRSRLVREAAYADPGTRCWRCGGTLDQHPPHKTGKPPHWTAGHVRDGDPTSPLLPEASTCNYAAGARLGNRRRRHRSLRWPPSNAEQQQATSARW